MRETKRRQAPGASYGYYVLFIAGIGGLLYGIDIGVVAAALLYLTKTISLTVSQTSAIVAAVLGGGMISSVVGGMLADWFGRKKMMIVSGLLFVTSITLIVLSHGFVLLMLGRLLQGFSGGLIAVVVPLYLAECLEPTRRGQGTAIFQFLLTVGIVLASLTGWFYTSRAEAAIAAAHGNGVLIHAAQDHAWRSMFFAVIFPGLLFFLGSFLLSESPRWLFRRGKRASALAALRKTSSECEAEIQLREMEALPANTARSEGNMRSLLQRKYIVPFVLACVVLACTQATGVNSILSYLVLILKQAGMTVRAATDGDLVVKVLNCLATLVAVALIERKGRKFLLMIGTGGILITLCTATLLFHSFESRRVDVRTQLQARVIGDRLSLPLDFLQAPSGLRPKVATQLLVLYSYGNGDKMVVVQSTDPKPELVIAPSPADGDGPLLIEHAFLGEVPGRTMGWLVAGCFSLFIMFFAVGPGVVNWLMLSELMPTRIRSAGMGVALLLNSAISTLIAGLFLPVVGRYGYHVMFTFWAAGTLIYFLTAVFFLPETKGKSLEEIEFFFEAPSVP